MTQFKCASLLMAALVASSNYLVQFPIHPWLTWGAFVYPVTYLVTEIVNQTQGPKAARQVVYIGFFMAALASGLLSSARIACASSVAFLVSQLLDIAIFSRLRAYSWWWVAPLSSSIPATMIDTGLFFFLAFFGTKLPWVTLGTGDLLVKLLLDLTLLLPFRLFYKRAQVQAAARSAPESGL